MLGSSMLCTAFPTQVRAAGRTGFASTNGAKDCHARACGSGAGLALITPRSQLHGQARGVGRRVGPLRTLLSEEGRSMGSKREC